MRYYSVHAPEDERDDPERFLFVKDGFSWPAFFVPILWLLWHRLWLALVWYVVFILVVAWAGRLLNEDIAFITAVLGSILFALEANNIRRLALAGRGFTEVGSSFGKNADEAEVRFFAGDGTPVGAADRQAMIARAAYSPERPAPTSDEPILGLFPEPER